MFQDRLLRGSFKGVRFNFEDSNISDGGNNIIHQYVNSNRVDSEIVGRDARVFKLKIFISGDTWENYTGQREALEGVLREGAQGDLVHPLHGAIYVAVNAKYSLNENISKLAKAEFSVSFAMVDRQAFSRRFTPTPQKLYQQGDLLAQSKANQMGDDYSLDSLSAVEQAQKFVKDTTALFKDATSLINDPTKAGEFASQLLGFEKGSFTSGVDLARDVYGLYATANSFIDRAIDRFGFFKNMFGFGDDEPTIPQTTRTRVAQAENQILQRTIIQSSALVFATQSASEIDYTTEDELESNNASIQIQFGKVLDDDGTTDYQYTELQTIRVDFTELVKELTLDVSRIIEITVVDTGLSTIIYKYYGVAEGSTSYNSIYSLIISLNNLEETGGITGTLKIVSEENVA